MKLVINILIFAIIISFYTLIENEANAFFSSTYHGI